MSYNLSDFVAESNRIEGINRNPLGDEIEAHVRLLNLSLVQVIDLEHFVVVCAGVPLRREAGMDVRVGGYRPPPGGPDIERQLAALLKAIEDGRLDPYEAHVRYETIHPFIDGNGRSGRALWLWHMLRDGRDPWALPFLHRWYYESLQAGRHA